MSQNEIDELLVEWELSRQRGQPISVEELCAEVPHLAAEVDTRIEILRRTEWMLQDPAPLPFADQVQSSLEMLMSRIDRPQDTFSSLGDDTREQNQAEIEYARVRLSRQPDGQGTPPPETIAQQLDQAGFAVVDELGRGGFGVVYRAMDKRLDRQVAIKVPLIANERSRSRYLQEARNAALVEVPGLIPVLQVGETLNGTPFVVQKLIEGQTLSALLASGGPLSPDQVAAVLLPVCEATGAAHMRSIVHRDLKPANIIIDNHGSPWIVDFGLAFTEDEIGSDLNHQSPVAGTPAYMAPEQLSDQVERLDGRADIWALGVILYELLTGKRPFRGRTLAELRGQIRQHDPRPISQRLPQLGGAWDYVFRRCCAKDISERFASTTELAAAMKKALDSQESSSHHRNAVLAEMLSADSIPLALTNKPAAAWSDEQSATGSSRAEQADSADSAGAPVIKIISYVAVGAIAAALLLAIGLLSLNSRSGAAPAFPLRVAADGTSTYATIQEALVIAAGLEAGAARREILIAPGTYNEPLALTDNIELRAEVPVGQDATNLVQIGVDGGPAITVMSSATVRLSGLSIVETAPTIGDAHNAIVVQGGDLALDHCYVESAGYDCIRLEQGSRLSAQDSTFRTEHHPAIYARQAQALDIRLCTFEILGTAGDAGAERVGLQVRQSGGSVTQCKFMGHATSDDLESQVRATGIEWGDSRQPVRIDDCQFDSLQQGLNAYSCEQVALAGVDGSSFSNCRVAIELSSCGGSIRDCTIDGLDVKGSVGIQLDNNANDQPWSLRSCTVRRTERAVVINQAKVEAQSMVIPNCIGNGITVLSNAAVVLTEPQIRNCRLFGLLVESSQAELTGPEIEGCYVGIVVDGNQQALKCTGGRFARNEVGLLLTSGSAELSDAYIEGADTGVIISRKHALHLPVTGDAPLQLTVHGGRIEASIQAISVLSPASCRLVDCIMKDPDGGRVAAGRDLDRSEQQGTTIFRLRP